MIKSARIIATLLLSTLVAGTAFADIADIDHRVQAARNQGRRRVQLLADGVNFLTLAPEIRGQIKFFGGIHDIIFTTAPSRRR